MKKFLRHFGQVAFVMIIAALTVGAGFGVIFGIATFATWLLSFAGSILGTAIAILLGLIVSALIITGIDTWMENHNGH